MVAHSYKLWYAYLEKRRLRVRGRVVTHPSYEIVNEGYERALVTLHKMPVIWLDYCQFLMDQKKITRTRRAFDRALAALPVTQHHRIWKLYMTFVKQADVMELSNRVYRRYLKLEPGVREEYIDFLLSTGQFDEAASQLAIIVNDEEFTSKKDKTKHVLWMELCELCSKHPLEIRSVKPESIIRSGLKRFSDETGRLWCALADYFIRQGAFEKARDIYEEALATVMTVRDFSTVFDAYTQFEEGMLAARMEDEEEDGDKAEDADEEADGDLEMRMARFEELMERRPFLLSTVLLRQNPHNVHEWHKRAKLFKERDQLVEAVNCYAEAVKTVDPLKAVGKVHSLWTSFAKFYETNGDMRNADVIFEKATKVPFKKLEELAAIWCEWAEMHIRHDGLDRALEIMQTAVKEPSKKEQLKKTELTRTVQDMLYKSTKIWSFYVDLEESIGSVESAKAAYDRMIDLKIVTPQIILNYASFLEENKYFEEAFRAYERGVSLFNFPYVKDIWMAYLKKFVERYGAKKLERARDLYEQCVEKVPATEAKTFFILYSELEEKFGLTRHAMGVLDRATRAVSPEDQLGMYNYYIAKAEEYYGAPKTREIYERGVQELPDAAAADLSVKFADMERKLGEIDRARAIYVHGSQFCNPRTFVSFWSKWEAFEVAHGNEDTYRDMLRIKRTVGASFSAVNEFAADAVGAEVTKQPDMAPTSSDPVPATSAPRGIKRKADVGGSAESEMEALERAISQPRTDE